MYFRKRSDFMNKMDEMIQSVNKGKKGYYACIIPEEKGKQGAFISEYGTMPILSYAVLYSDEESRDIEYDCIMNASIATMDKLQQIAEEDESKIIVFSDDKSEGGFCVKNQKFLLERGKEGFAYLYIKCVSIGDKSKIEQFLYVFDSSLKNQNGKMMRLCTGEESDEISTLILKMSELISGKEK